MKSLLSIVCCLLASIAFGAPVTVDPLTKIVTSPAGAITFPSTVTATAFVGGGSGLTGLDAGDISAGTLAVARGGTGVSTSGTTSEIPVGGGTGSPIVWTTATGTGAPVRAGGPTFTGTTIVADFQITGAFNTAGATGVFTLNPDNQGSINNMNVGQTTARAGAFTIAAATSLALGGATIGSHALASSGSVLVTASGASSAGALLLTGTPFDGDATTSVPLMLWLQTGASASTTWGTSGTLLGGKYTAGYAGDWMNFKASNDVTVFFVGNGGNLTTGGTITSGVSVLAASGSFVGFNGSSLISTGGTNGNFKFQNSSAANAFMLSGDSSNALMKVGATAGNRDGWMQWAGQAYIDANGTNATGTLATTGLSVTLVAGRKYSFKLILYVANSLAADGVKIDFDGGTATATNFRAHATLFDSALLLSQQVSALATDIAQATCTGDAMIEVHGSITVNAGGTFIPRYAGNSAVSGTLTLYRGSHLLMFDMP